MAIDAGTVRASGTVDGCAGHDTFARHIVPELDILMRVARSLARTEADAEDLVQETLLRAFRAIGGFDGRHPRAWLLTIMRNTHTSTGRRRRPLLLDDPDALGALGDPALPEVAEPATMVVNRTFDGAVARAFNRLPVNHRKVVALIDLYGLSYKEAAAATGAPLGTIMSRLHRGRLQIRQDLAAAGLGPGCRP